MLTSRARIACWCVALSLAALSVAAWLGPTLYIQPFRAQSARGLDAALALREAAPILCLVTAIACLAGAALLWRGSTAWWRRAALIAAPALAFLAVTLTHWNHFESMFAPLGMPQFVKVSDSDFVEKDDIVLAVVVAGDAAAYPVRQMAYHHVVQDDVGGVPLVATY